METFRLATWVGEGPESPAGRRNCRQATFENWWQHLAIFEKYVGVLGGAGPGQPNVWRLLFLDDPLAFHRVQTTDISWVIPI